MLDFFRDGGFNMWLLLLSFIATVVLAAGRKGDDRVAVLVGGCIVSLILGLLGISMGLIAVATNYQRFPEPLAALAQGLNELSNNGTFGALLATLQGMGAIVARSKSREV